MDHLPSTATPPANPCASVDNFAPTFPQDGPRQPMGPPAEPPVSRDSNVCGANLQVPHQTLPKALQQNSAAEHMLPHIKQENGGSDEGLQQQQEASRAPAGAGGHDESSPPSPKRQRVAYAGRDSLNEERPGSRQAQLQQHGTGHAHGLGQAEPDVTHEQQQQQHGMPSKDGIMDLKALATSQPPQQQQQQHISYPAGESISQQPLAASQPRQPQPQEAEAVNRTQQATPGSSGSGQQRAGSSSGANTGPEDLGGDEVYHIPQSNPEPTPPSSRPPPRLARRLLNPASLSPGTFSTHESG